MFYQNAFGPPKNQEKWRNLQPPINSWAWAVEHSGEQQTGQLLDSILENIWAPKGPPQNVSDMWKCSLQNIEWGLKIMWQVWLMWQMSHRRWSRRTLVICVWQVEHFQTRRIIKVIELVQRVCQGRVRLWLGLSGMLSWNVPGIMFHSQRQKAPQQEWPVHGILHSPAGVPAGHRNISLTRRTSQGIKNITRLRNIRLAGCRNEKIDDGHQA